MNFDKEKLIDFLLECGNETKIYVGCDSERVRVGKEFFIDYTLVVVVHINGRNGCRVFGFTIREKSYDQNRKDRQTFRLINEAYKLGEFYMLIEDILRGFDVYIHLDYNPKKEHLSNQVVQQGIGYLKGITGFDDSKIKIKDQAWAASYGADRFKEIATLRSKPLKMPGYPEPVK